MKKVHNKLVRDFIPQIIAQDGKKAHVRTLDEKEMITCLKNKLIEEVNEYLENESVEELADVLEVIYALCQNKKISIEELERTRKRKKIARGSFDERVFLEDVED